MLLQSAVLVALYLFAVFIVTACCQVSLAEEGQRLTPLGLIVIQVLTLVVFLALALLAWPVAT